MSLAFLTGLLETNFHGFCKTVNVFMSISFFERYFCQIEKSSLTLVSPFSNLRNFHHLLCLHCYWRDISFHPYCFPLYIMYSFSSFLTAFKIFLKILNCQQFGSYVPFLCSSLYLCCLGFAELLRSVDWYLIPILGKFSAIASSNISYIHSLFSPRIPVTVSSDLLLNRFKTSSIFSPSILFGLL